MSDHDRSNRPIATALMYAALVMPSVLGVGKPAAAAEGNVPAAAARPEVDRTSPHFAAGRSEGIEIGRMMGKLETLIETAGHDAKGINQRIQKLGSAEQKEAWNETYDSIKASIAEISKHMSDDPNVLARQVKEFSGTMAHLKTWGLLARALETPAEGRQVAGGAPRGGSGPMDITIRHGDIISLEMWERFRPAFDQIMGPALDRVMHPEREPDYSPERARGAALKKRLDEEGRRIGEQIRPRRENPTK